MGVAACGCLRSQRPGHESRADAGRGGPCAVVRARALPVLGTGHGWRALLGLNLAADADVALVAAARQHEVELHFFRDRPERESASKSEPFGKRSTSAPRISLKLSVAPGSAARPPEQVRGCPRGRPQTRTDSRCGAGRGRREGTGRRRHCRRPGNAARAVTSCTRFVCRESPSLVNIRFMCPRTVLCARPVTAAISRTERPSARPTATSLSA